MLLWHYTVGTHLPKIVADGFLKLTPRPERLDKDETAAVWFSSNQTYEETAAKGKEVGGVVVGHTSMPELMVLARGIFRIGVENRPPIISYREYKERKMASKWRCQMLERGGRDRRANPREWYVCLEVVPREMWVTVEQWDGIRWVPVPGERWIR
jgi:hypothetical protein